MNPATSTVPKGEPALVCFLPLKKHYTIHYTLYTIHTLYKDQHVWTFTDALALSSRTVQRLHS